MSEVNTENTSPKKSGKNRKRKPSNTAKGVWLYLIVFALVFAFCCLRAVFQMTSSRSVTVTINSASVSRGQNPDGTAFDVYKILSDEVLEAAAEKLGGGISVAELKHHLSVSDALIAKTNQQLKQSILDGEHENIYFPTVYSLTYSAVSDEMNPQGFGHMIAFFRTGLSSDKMDRILEAVTESYQAYYESTFLTYDAMFEIDWEDIDTMDYYNRAEALKTEAMRILRFLQDRSAENRTTFSSTKLTYGDLENDLWQLISVDIENHQAYIIQNNITTSRKALLRQFRYMEEIYKEEKERKTEEYLILDEAVDMYDSSTTKVVFIPALDQNDSFYMNRTKVGLDYLVESADAARLAADEAEHNAQYYQYLQACFADSVTPKKSQINHADTVYQNIKNRIEEVNQSVKVLLEESNQSENKGIKVSNADMSVGIVGVAMSFAKQFVILSMAGYVLICLLTAFSGKKKQTEAREV